MKPVGDVSTPSDSDWGMATPSPTPRGDAGLKEDIEQKSDSSFDLKAIAGKLDCF